MSTCCIVTFMNVCRRVTVIPDIQTHFHSLRCRRRGQTGGSLRLSKFPVVVCGGGLTVIDSFDWQPGLFPICGLPQRSLYLPFPAEHSISISHIYTSSVSQSFSVCAHTPSCPSAFPIGDTSPFVTSPPLIYSSTLFPPSSFPPLTPSLPTVLAVFTPLTFVLNIFLTS